jgi:hypothetical protein
MARYRELRSRRLRTALGEVELSRPWYLCAHVTTANSSLTAGSTSKTTTALPACVAWRPWWVRRLSSITVVSKGKTDGQPAHTREVKLGCVFTLTAWDKEGYAIRGPDSTTYTGAIETAEEFGTHLSRSLEPWLEPRVKESGHG